MKGLTRGLAKFHTPAAPPSTQTDTPSLTPQSWGRGSALPSTKFTEAKLILLNRHLENRERLEQGRNWDEEPGAGVAAGGGNPARSLNGRELFFQASPPP